MELRRVGDMAAASSYLFLVTRAHSRRGTSRTHGGPTTKMTKHVAMKMTIDTSSPEMPRKARLRLALLGGSRGLRADRDRQRESEGGSGAGERQR